MKQALLIIDVQNDYFPDGKMPLSSSLEALSNTLILQNVFRQTLKPIIYIQHIKTALSADFFVKESIGAELHPALLPLKTEQEEIIIKHYPNSFVDTLLPSLLLKQKIEQLIICGMMTHMCVDSTTRRAAELGYQPILIADACATRSLYFQGVTVDASDVQAAFLGALTNFSQVVNTQNFINSFN